MDIYIVRKLASLHGRNILADAFFAHASSYSAWIFAAAFLISVLFAVFFRKKERLGLITAAFLIPSIAVSFNYAVRSLVSRQRPFEVIDGLVPLVSHSPGNSFPSNHAAAGFAVACFIYMVKPSAGIVFLVLSFLVSFSRVYAGLHYPSDVLAGAVIACVVSAFIGLKSASLAGAAGRLFRNRKNKRQRV